MRVLCKPSEWRFNVRFTLCQLVTSNEAIGGFAGEWSRTPGTAGPLSSGFSQSFGLAQIHRLCVVWVVRTTRGLYFGGSRGSNGDIHIK